MATRIILDVPDEKEFEFDGMQEALNLSSREDLANLAFAILETMVRQRKLGRTAAFIDETSKMFHSLSHPALDAIKPQAQVPLNVYIVTLCHRAVKQHDSQK